MSKRKLRVYIASPYTQGDPAINVKRQMDVFNMLMDHGVIPFAPTWAHFQHLYEPKGYEEWMEWCLEWVQQCDAVLRLEGYSPGADREVELAEKLGIKVFYNIYSVINFLKCN